LTEVLVTGIEIKWISVKAYGRGLRERNHRGRLGRRPPVKALPSAAAD
jgi:hypothetical protein